MAHIHLSTPSAHPQADGHFCFQEDTMRQTYITMLKALGDKAFYCAGFLYAANKPVAASELVALTHYKRPTVTRLLVELERRGMVVRVERGWRIAPERSPKRK